MRIEFSKYQGSGNDFIIINDWDGKFEGSLKGLELKDFVKRICERHRGVGADGLIILKEPREGGDLRWKFFNSDGSVAEMCGNGSRCAVKFAYDRGLVKKEEVVLETEVGLIPTLIKGERVRVQLTEAGEVQEKEVEGYRGYFTNTGVPHFVVFVEELEKFPVLSVGRRIRFSREFKPKGSNVNFAQVLDEKTVKVRTYERGVEGETLSCGTGATAVAHVSALLGFTQFPTSIITRGGEVLTIYKKGQYLHLEGSVRWVFDGKLDLKNLL